MAQPCARPRRIHITGGQGSGKTTLARRLGEHLDLPAYDLDLVGWDIETGLERPLAVRLAEVHRLAAQPAWITEGTMLGWTDALLRAADVIIWLDVPWRVAVWRMAVRHIRTGFAGRNRHPGVRRLLRFIWYSRGYYRGSSGAVPIPVDGEGRANRAETEDRLSVYSDKVVHCYGATDIRAILARFS